MRQSFFITASPCSLLSVIHSVQLHVQLHARATSPASEMYASTVYAEEDIRDLETIRINYII